MRKRQYLVSVLLCGVWALLCNAAVAEERNSGQDAVEVVIKGKHYKSIREYKRTQIERTLQRSLSSHNLMEFTEEELYEIMLDVRKQQAGGTSSETDQKAVLKNKDPDLLDLTVGEDPQQKEGVSQMHDMLRQYRKKHKSADHLYIDSKKVKSVIIDPQEAP